MRNLDEQLTLETWDKRSAVRNKPNTYSIIRPSDEAQHQCDWFPRAMLPFLKCPQFEHIAEESIHRLLAEHLIYFLDYTVILEHLFVNRSLEVIMYDSLKANLTRELSATAMQIYTDEGYHALFSNQLARDVSKKFSIRRRSRMPFRLEALSELISETNPEERDLISFCIGFISETIIAKEIAQITTTTLAPQAYALLKDHLEDEKTHAWFFSIAFQEVWCNATNRQRRVIAKSLPLILKTFCLTDEAWLAEVLHETGVSPEFADSITTQINSESSIVTRVMSVAAMTLSVLRKNGLFSNREYANHFTTAGLPDA